MSVGNRGRRAVSLLSSTGLTHWLLGGAAVVLFPGVAAAQSLPVGGSVAAGAATIATSARTTTVTQTSARGVINWTSFDVGQGNAVVFRQPNAQSATLNRVTGGTTSTIAGSITSNGAVYLVNPNGIAITSTGSVATGGGFVASTLGIADGDFMAGNLAFAGSGKSSRVTNAGTIAAGSGGYVALLGGGVSDSGTINVPLGRVGLASGESVAMDLNGDGFLRVAVPTQALTKGNTALIEQTGRIAASGGRVVLSAATARNAVRNVINMPGSISADSATGSGGSIVLSGGDGGIVHATGTLSARATGRSGDGGFIETSGATVDFTGVRADTSATNGRAGTWLVDPTNLTVDANAAATIRANLANSNVTLQTTANGATGPGTQTPGNGDIVVNSAISWTSTNTLSLLAYNNINLNAAITAPAGQLTLTAGNGVSATGTVTANGAINVGIFNLTNGNWTQNSAILPAFYAHDFRFTVGAANFLRVTSGNGSSVNPYTIADIYGLQGLGSQNYRAASFKLSNDIDASGTVNWNSGAGWLPVGTNLSVAFTGNFDGAHHIVTDLWINRVNSSPAGLFAYSQGFISNVGLVGGTVSGSTFVGALVGSQQYGLITNSYATTNVISTSGYAGGLIGFLDSGNIRNSYATGSVNTTNNGGTGGLIGVLTNGNASNVYATGDVNAASSYDVGGLIGYVSGSSATNAYATGSVLGYLQVGGLIGGLYNSSTVASIYATGAVTGTNTVGGLVGDLYSGTVSNGYWDSYSTGQAFAFGPGNGLHIVAVTSDPNQSNAANYAFKASAYANLTTASDIGNGAVNGFVFLPDSAGTRPFLAFEVPSAALNGSNAAGQTYITNAHQLQLIGYDATRLAGGYVLGNNIDLAETGRVVAGSPSSYSGMWDRTGFYALGQSGFSGSLSGAGHVLSNLFISEQDSGQGLFNTIAATGIVSDLGLVDARVSGTSAVGVIAGTNAGNIVRSYATGMVTGSDTYAGGLVGVLASGGQIINAYANVAVFGRNGVGGLVGYMSGGTISNTYALGSVTGSSLNAGGLVGTMNAGSIAASYATGWVGGSGMSKGGLVASVGPSASITSSYWDSYSTGQPIGVNYVTGTVTNLMAVTSEPSKSAALNYAYRASAYANLTASTDVGSATPTGFVFMPGNSTRPFLAFEVPAAGLYGTDGQGRVQINTSHQLQLIGYGAQTLSGSYLLGRSISLAETGGLVSGTAASYAGMWSLAGFVPIGTDGAGLVFNGDRFVALNTIAAGDSAGFLGSFDGGGYSLGSLTINRGTIKNVGLFGVTSGTLRNVALIGGSVSGLNGVGGLAGLQFHGLISGSSSSASVMGNNLVGGIVGNQLAGTAITDSVASGAVRGVADVGGLVGYAQGTILRSSASGTVNGSTYVGGLVGYAFNATIQGTASGNVNGTSYAGGLIGILDGGTTTGTPTGSVNGTSGGNPPVSQVRNGGVYSAQ